MPMGTCSGVQRFLDARGQPLFKKKISLLFPVKISLMTCFSHFHLNFNLHVSCCDFNYLIAPVNTSARDVWVGQRQPPNWIIRWHRLDARAVAPPEAPSTRHWDIGNGNCEYLHVRVVSYNKMQISVLAKSSVLHVLKRRWCDGIQISGLNFVHACIIGTVDLWLRARVDVSILCEHTCRPKDQRKQFCMHRQT